MAKIISKNFVQSMDSFLFPNMTANASGNMKEKKQQQFYNVNAGGSNDVNKNIGNSFIPVPPGRVKADIGSWRDGILEMERPILPYRYIVQTIFRDVYLDPQVFACVQKRYNLTLLRKFALVDEKGNEDIEWTKYLNKSWFRNLLRYILDAQFYGYSLISLGDLTAKKGKLPEFRNPVELNRDRVSPEGLYASSVPRMPSGISWEEEDKNPWHIYVPTINEHGTSSCGFGIFYTLAQETIKLRDMIGDNTDFMQRYASPFMALFTDVTDETERTRREQMMDTNASLGWGLFKKDEELKIIQSQAGGGGYKSYGDFESRIHKLISKVLLLHSDAIDSTAGKLGGSQGGKESPSQSALYDVQQSDANFIEPIINEELLYKLREFHGIPIPENLTFKFLNSEEEAEIQRTLDAKNLNLAIISKNLATSPFNISKEYFEEETGINCEANKLATTNKFS